MDIKISSTTITTNRLELGRKELLKLLPEIPATADIYISIPGGGDWSNMDLDVTTEHPIVVTWKVRSES